MKSRPLATYTLSALVLLWGATARADVVGPPPDDCPAGYTSPSTCHGGAHCRLIRCVDNSKCSSGSSCQQHRLCIKRINCSGMKPTPTWVDSVTGSCQGGSACGDGSSCTTVKICKATTPDGSGTDSESGDVPSRGCSCQLAGTAAAPMGWVLPGLALLWVARRRS